jgi:hypothetical protein
MSEVKVNKISPRTNCGTVQLGDSGDTITIPSGATITNNGTQTGFGRTGTVDWDTTPKTASFNATSGDGFFCNTTSSAFTATLPSGAAGAIVSLADYAGTWQTNNLTVSPQSGEKIGGVSADVVLNTEGQSVTFVYVDGTQGWVNVQDSTSNERGETFITATGGTITTCGNDKIHTFTGPGTFCVSQIASCAPQNIVSYLVIAGGGSGGTRHGGGGGAGGYRELKSPTTPYTASPLDGYPSSPNRVTITATAFPITVGAGGAASCNNGNPSTFSTITSTAGGAGQDTSNGNAGGSGGGAAGPQGNVGGAGNTPPVSPPQGNPGGDNNPGTNYNGGGGGGAGAAGSSTPPAAPGGNGVATSITGSSVTRAGGGGGGSFAPQGTPFGPGNGGSGGGGRGASGASCVTAQNGTANTGGGGGGGGGNDCTPQPCAGGAGGSGVVIIRYKFQ